MDPRIEAALARGGVIARRRRPDLANALDGALRRGELVAVLPGVYAHANDAASLATLARAVTLKDPGAVILGESAGALMGWTDIPQPDALQVASCRIHARPGLAVTRRDIPLELRRRMTGFVVTSRALTAVDLCARLGGDVLDQALRRGVPLHELARAYQLTPGRPGNPARRLLLDDSRDRPWSPLEREAHRLLRAAPDTAGWVANRAIFDARGELAGVGDIVWEFRLVLEIDGDSYHRSVDQVEHDGDRDVRLARLAWMVVRLRGRVVRRPAEFLATVRDLLAGRRRQLGLG